MTTEQATTTRPLPFNTDVDASVTPALLGDMRAFEIESGTLFRMRAEADKAVEWWRLNLKLPGAGAALDHVEELDVLDGEIVDRLSTLAASILDRDSHSVRDLAVKARVLITLMEPEETTYGFLLEFLRHCE